MFALPGAEHPHAVVKAGGWGCQAAGPSLHGYLVPLPVFSDTSAIALVLRVWAVLGGILAGAAVL